MKKILIALIVMIGFAGTAISQTRVAHVKSNLLWDTLEISASAEAEMLEVQNMLAAEIQALEADLIKLDEEYQKIKKTGASQTLLTIKERNIQDKQIEYQKRSQSIQYELQVVRAELEAPIIEMIREATEIVAKSEKIDYIMDVNNALYVNEANDVTDKVLVELLKLEKEALAKAESSGTGTANGAGGAQ